MKNHDYESEQDLCEHFATYARTLGWKVYPETSNQDLLLVATPETKTYNARPGDQVAIQAKMHPNIEVLFQAMPKLHDTRGPHYHAVLVPAPTYEFKQLAARLGIWVFEATQHAPKGEVRKRSVKSELMNLPITYVHMYEEPLWFPEIEVIVPAGVRSPKSVSPWKMKAVQLCMLCLKKGYLLSTDFREAGMHVQNWVKRKWALPGDKEGRHKKYYVTDTAPHAMFPEIVEALKTLEDADHTITNNEFTAWQKMEKAAGIE